ncbi:MAG: Clp protease N-terminal domain-containing protein [Longimicrobiales bacterium]
MNYSFTDRTRKVLAMAREEAIRMKHDYVGTEHILLGLIREGEGVGVTALRKAGVDVGTLAARVHHAVRHGRSIVEKAELPYTSRSKKVLEYAMNEARQLNHAYVGTEHLLLGLLREERGIAAQTLNSVGFTIELARSSVVKLLSGEPESEPMANAVPPVGSDQDAVWYLKLDESSATAIHEQIVSKIEEAVAEGRLEGGERLPSVRDLAAELGVAPGTVARAYSELESRGVVRTEGAKGTRVASARTRPRRRADPAAGLERLLRRTVVAAFHRGATAEEVRAALERAMKGILRML